jgi:hypothetical protein
MWWASGFYGYFSVLLAGQTLSAWLGPQLRTTAGVVGSGSGGLLLWAVFALVQLYAVVRSVQGKRRAAGTVPAAGRDA